MPLPLLPIIETIVLGLIENETSFKPLKLGLSGYLNDMLLTCKMLQINEVIEHRMNTWIFCSPHWLAEYYNKSKPKF